MACNFTWTDPLHAQADFAPLGPNSLPLTIGLTYFMAKSMPRENVQYGGSMFQRAIYRPIINLIVEDQTYLSFIFAPTIVDNSRYPVVILRTTPGQIRFTFDDAGVAQRELLQIRQLVQDTYIAWCESYNALQRDREIIKSLATSLYTIISLSGKPKASVQPTIDALIIGLQTDPVYSDLLNRLARIDPKHPVPIDNPRLAVMTLKTYSVPKLVSTVYGPTEMTTALAPWIMAFTALPPQTQPELLHYLDNWSQVSFRFLNPGLIPLPRA